MRVVFYSLFFFITLVLQRELSEASPQQKVAGVTHAAFPPRGWNSYDSFSWIVSEQEFLQNAEIVSKRLRGHGYEYVVVDYLWYRKKVEGAYTNSLGFDVIDKWGRVIPDPGRWPSSKGGKGFTEVAKKVHAMGLKFGIHVMRGISTQAVNANTPIFDTVKGAAYIESRRVWRAKDIGLREKACAWMSQGFMSVDTNLGAGRAFLRSLYQQYAEWGVDFVKNDCVFGDDLDIHEISVVSEVLKELDRPILYSLSPGSSVTPAMAAEVSHLVNMYRITGDDWDKWEDVQAHFNVSRDFAYTNMIGVEGLQGKSWPDLDMLPLGWLTDPGSNLGPHRKSQLSLDEQRTQMTLWSMAKSPLIYGGDLRKLDQMTYDLITNPVLLEINSFSTKNMEFPYIYATKGNVVGTTPSRSLKEARRLNSHFLSLTSCKDQNAKAWTTEVLDHKVELICWNDVRENKYTQPFCLHKRKPHLTLDEEMIYEQRYQRKFHLLSTDTDDFCLDASRKWKLNSQETNKNSFSPCRWDANQMWELNLNGTLVSSYSGLCAMMKRNKAKADAGGIHSWIAAGKKGEIYVSFFNLNPVRTTISAKTSDLAKAIRSDLGSCKYIELWSGKFYGLLKQELSIALEKHACALFVVNCS